MADPDSMHFSCKSTSCKQCNSDTSKILPYFDTIVVKAETTVAAPEEKFGEKLTIKLSGEISTQGYMTPSYFRSEAILITAVDVISWPEENPSPRGII